VSTAPARLVSLEGRVALVAGGAGGIGSAISSLLLAAGARVVVLDRDGQEVLPGAVARACDLTDSAAVGAAVEAVAGEHRRLDIVVHCAGIVRDGLLLRMSDEDWRAVMGVNLDSAFYLLRASVPALRAAGGGSVALVSSINGERGKAGQVNYCASKGGLIAFARASARELGRFGIRVNVVSPGWIETPMTAGLSADLRQRAQEESALGRLGEPEDVARAVLFLCSELSHHVTGQVLRVDGGQLIG
jgi:3-oxoacyl-[acyl-carrier protein] reductase